jgi:hypothetical protein
MEMLMQNFSYLIMINPFGKSIEAQKRLKF